MRVVAKKEKGGQAEISLKRKVRVKKLMKDVLTAAYKNSNEQVPSDEILDETAAELKIRYTF